MNITGPADPIAKLQIVEAKAERRKLAHRVARHLIAKWRIPPEYIDLTQDPLDSDRPDLLEAIACWVLALSDEQGLSIKAIGVSEISRCMGEHLADVFGEECLFAFD